MKKILLHFTLVAFTALLFISCKKEKNEPDSVSYISFNLNGSQKNFKAKTVAVKVTQSDFYSIGFTAFQDTVSSEHIYIQVSQKGKPITTGTYVDPGPDSNDLLVVAGYLPPSQDEAKIYSAGLQEDNNPRLKVIINSITANNISGTFSGTFYDHDGDGPGTAAVDGKLNLPLY